jgi:8-amino-7-oxononanoate synthase
MLAADAAAGLIRLPRRRSGGSHRRASIDGRSVIVFSSNDYLGLSVHPAVRRAAAESARRDGVGSTGSRHLSGCHAAIDELEEDLARFEGTATATLAPTGFAANLSVLRAVGGHDCVIFSDERNHASIVDGCRLASRHVEVFRHRDLDDLERRLAHTAGRPIVVSDTVFSMDGTVADVAGLHRLARTAGAWLVLDEAHATGVLGTGGGGAAAEAGLDPRDEQVIRVVTLSKALGSSGGVVCASSAVRSLLLQRGRGLIYSTAPALPVVAAARAALQVLFTTPALVDQLRARATRMRSMLSDLNIPGRSDLPIVPVMVTDPDRSVALEASILERGHLVQAVRPPTVPAGTSRLRIVVTVVHTNREIDALAHDLKSLLAA